MKFLIWFLRLFGLYKLASFLEGGQQGLDNQQAQECQEALDAQAEIVQEVENETAQAEADIRNSSNDNLAEYLRTGGMPRGDKDNPAG